MEVVEGETAAAHDDNALGEPPRQLRRLIGEARVLHVQMLGPRQPREPKLRCIIGGRRSQVTYLQGVFSIERNDRGTGF